MEKGLLHKQIRDFFVRNFDVRQEKEDELETIESIRKGIEFKGTNLWVLIFATFVASLGLNTNSTAVIIGAMLISPLMGPIMGFGLGLGISDFDLIKRSFRNFATATVFSVITSTLFFLISPISEAQSELLARTQPTVYDVLIAFFGPGGDRGELDQEQGECDSRRGDRYGFDAAALYGRIRIGER